MRGVIKDLFPTDQMFQLKQYPSIAINVSNYSLTTEAHGSSPAKNRDVAEIYCNCRAFCTFAHVDRMSRTLRLEVTRITHGPWTH
jgi:hypothetical protein